MSEVADDAARLLADGTDLRGLTDAEIRRRVVTEMLDISADHSDDYVAGAFKGLTEGDARFAQAGRAQRKRRIAILHAAEPPEGGLS